MKKVLCCILAVIILLASMPTLFTAAAYALGDVDGDGVITIMDVTRIQRSVAELVNLNQNERSSADVDHDGTVTILDATRIQRYIAELCNLDGSIPYSTQPPATEPPASEEPLWTEPLPSCAPEPETTYPTQPVPTSPPKPEQTYPTEPEPTYPTEPQTETPRFGVKTPVISQIEPVFIPAEHHESIDPGVILHWDTVPGAAGYALFYRSQDDTHWHRFLSLLEHNVSQTPVIHETTLFNAIAYDKTYRFTVRALSNDGSEFISDFTPTEEYRFSVQNPEYTGAYRWATASGVSDNRIVFSWNNPKELQPLEDEYYSIFGSNFYYQVFLKQNGKWKLQEKKYASLVNSAYIDLTKVDDRRDIEIAVRCAAFTVSNIDGRETSFQISGYDIFHISVTDTITASYDPIQYHIEYR